ncbi:dodecin domain-containing protein [uncultured Legionella sp.]|uniref:dodecin domain-containing protein n=1 Tax=uncultured Legionella sp. TaxID=210934 RepID=UPI002609A88D|nr:dodecin domain-containing protein [uncultured Legionella sp.]
MKSIEDFVGLSEYGIDDAVQNALENAGNPANYEVVETLGSQDNNTKRQYQVTLKAITK